MFLMSQANLFDSWGRYPRYRHEIAFPRWRVDDGLIPSSDQSVLPCGMGRSYGDSCLNQGGLLLSNRYLDRFIAFDEAQGVIQVESGVTLEQLLQFIVPRGWFLPVSPGTKFVSVGGAIANDIHGKNHHKAGTFGCHVRAFELARSDGGRLYCTPSENSEYFRATIGGLGLTGFVLWAEIQLLRIQGPFIDMESIKFSSLDEFFEISRHSDKDYDYSMAWLDAVSAGRNFGRGIFMRGNHSKTASGEVFPKSFLKSLLQVPFELPSFTLNRLSVRAFNELYYQKQFSKHIHREIHFDPFFYPLDSVRNWNRIYGSRGFVQFQCALPIKEKYDTLSNILKIVVDSGKASFLAVLKEFGDVTSPGLMSFPMPGTTLCLDFPVEGERTFQLMRQLDNYVASVGGRLYPAKDACMTPENFRTYYPQWSDLEALRDPRFSSSFWRRVLQGTGALKE